VHEGEILALLGTNGAGKSTLLKAISGLAPAHGGTIMFDGEDITKAGPNKTAEMGIAQVPGGRGIFPSLNVQENLRVAGWLYRKDKAYLEEATKRVVEYFPALERRWTTAAGSLSGGEQQMLSLAQAFLAKPKLLMIDELSLGLAPTIVDRLLDIVNTIHENGTTIILVEQSVNVALRIAKRAVFMEKGEVRFSGPTEELLGRTDILRSVFLKGAASVEESSSQNGAKKRTSARARKEDRERRDALLEKPIVLETVGLTKRYGGVTAVNSVDLQLHEDQILGLIGPNGAGKTSVFDLISGFSKADGGRVLLRGQDVTDWPAWRRADAGLARSFQDARLWPSLTVREALAVSMRKQAEVTHPLPAMAGLPLARESEAAIGKRVEELIAMLGLGAFRDKFIAELSTGSRRMVEIATLLPQDPDVIVLDEPSSGIAQKETEALGPVLRQVQKFTGCAILIIEHDMPLISSLADHIVGLELGAVIAFGTPDEVLNHPAVVESYLGNTSYAELQEAASSS
jgi:ABC-type branched-subunit amino acid transport system ATPase component